VCSGYSDNLRRPVTICGIRASVVVAAMDDDLSLATSTCSRTRCAAGTLLELVNLHGIRGELSEEALDRFVASFPIQMLAPR
jgi:hypothetical protein